MMNLSTREGMQALIRRLRLQFISTRSQDLDDVRAMLNGSYEPPRGWIAPDFVTGSAREEAWKRALRTVTPAAALIMQKSLAGIDFGAISWSDAESNADEVNDAVARLNLPTLARDLAIEYKTTGVAAAMASIPEGDDEGEGTTPVIAVMRGVNVPYTDPRDQATVTGWFRTIEYALGQGQLAWWTEVYDFVDDERTTHRVWKQLAEPTHLGAMPDEEYESLARPRFAINDLQPDGLPVSPMLTHMGRIMGLYASELRLAASEEVAAFPMLFLTGGVDIDRVGAGEIITADEGADARWLQPGDLNEMREQVRLKRDQVREAFALPGGSLGAQTPSGEALQEANRGFLQESHRLSDMLSSVLTAAVTDYLALLNLPPVEVSVPVDRSYMTSILLDVVEKGVDLRAVPTTVAARIFQQFLGHGVYSDDELEEHTAVLSNTANGVPIGALFARDTIT